MVCAEALTRIDAGYDGRESDLWHAPRRTK
jgi:hypothetical protein